MKEFVEIDISFYDEELGLYMVDGYTTDENEGEVVATINPKTNEIVYKKKEYEFNKLIHNAIYAFLYNKEENKTTYYTV